MIAPAILNALQPKWTPYIPHSPSPKQLAYLCLQNKEAFYGGAAGGGKSDAVLMGALQYVDVPKYSAIIFRKTFTDLTLPGALIHRSHEWLDGTDAKWHPQQHAWTFPAGSSLVFGYLASELDPYRYQSAEFQYIGFDELSQFDEFSYTYLFSRLRKTRCPKVNKNRVAHALQPDPHCRSCQEYHALSKVPLRLRSASNPGGIGHGWIKNRFQIKKVDGIYRGTHPKRAYVPAFLKDNKYLNEREYRESLSHLSDPVTREQLLAGDWGISPDGRFHRSWIKRYGVNGTHIVLGQDLRGRTYPIESCMKIMVVDPAASSQAGPADVQIFRERAPSWTVIGIFYITPDWDLIFWDMIRFRREIPDVVKTIIRVFKKERPEWVCIEYGGTNLGVCQYVQKHGLPFHPLMPRANDKVVRSTDIANRMEQGKVYFPDTNFHPTASQWLEIAETELFTWTGHPHQPADIVDVMSYAGMMVSDLAADQDVDDPNNAHIPKHFTDEELNNTTDFGY